MQKVANTLFPQVLLLAYSSCTIKKNVYCVAQGTSQIAYVEGGYKD